MSFLRDIDGNIYFFNSAPGSTGCVPSPPEKPLYLHHMLFISYHNTHLVYIYIIYTFY